jgi:hypothetical protein
MSETPQSMIRRPGPTFTNIVIDNCGAGIRMDGGHANVDGLVVRNTPTVFELNNGATVDATRVRHESSRPKKRKRGRRNWSHS